MKYIRWFGISLLPAMLLGIALSTPAGCASRARTDEMASQASRHADAAASAGEQWQDRARLADAEADNARAALATLPPPAPPPDPASGVPPQPPDPIVERQRAQLESQIRDRLVEARAARAAAQSAEAVAQSLRAAVAAYQRVVGDIDHGAAAGGESQDPITWAVQRGLGWLPEPVRWPATLLAGAGLLLWRNRRLYAAGRDIVRSIDRAKREVPTFAAAFADASDIIREGQGPDARRFVDSVQK